MRLIARQTDILSRLRLVMSSHQQFIQLLEQLTIADNAVRSASEKRYEGMKADASVLPFLPLYLLEALGDATVAGHVRQLAAVLLRRLLVEQEDSVYRSMDVDKLVSCSPICIEIIRKYQTCSDFTRIHFVLLGSFNFGQIF